MYTYIYINIHTFLEDGAVSSVSQPVLELIVLSNMTLNSQSSCFFLLNYGIIVLSLDPQFMQYQDQN